MLRQFLNWAQGDLDGDGQVASADFLLLSANFGHQAPDAAALGVNSEVAATDALFAALPTSEDTEPDFDLDSM